MKGKINRINYKERPINFFHSLTKPNKTIFRDNYQHVAIVCIALTVIIFNVLFGSVSFAYENQVVDLSYLDPQMTNKVVKGVAEYTKFEEDIESMEVALAVSENDEYLGKVEGVSTEKSKLEREYIVQDGDTVTTIASKFGLHVASILDRNGLTVDTFENIQPGQTIIIPASDTSDSKQWLADLNYKKEQERQRLLAEEEARKAEQEKQRQLALKKKTTSYTSTTSTKKTSSTGYVGSFSGGFIVPIAHKGISRGISSSHTGIDYRANIGTPVKAAASGKVVGITTGYGSGYGLSVLIDHGSGWTTRYAHLNSFASSVGDQVGQGQVIGYSGNTGWSTGPHLHFETRCNGSVVSPF